jgi:4-diphosphocytidyl-2-C-methyl-D-erythritol kinase
MSAARQARVRALAKINLDLRVLGKRADGYHELRTIFQTVSLADRLDISFTPARTTAIELKDSAAIPDNLVVRAARFVLDAMRKTGRIAMRLEKRIPMGAGLGGGSSDAAAVLLALPALAGGRPLPLETLCAIGQQIGSDVPFFLLGGTAVGIGRGTELFPLPDEPARPGLIVAPGVHVSTAEAYGALSPRLTIQCQENKIFSFQSHTWAGLDGTAENDFEAVVLEQESLLRELKQRLIQAGASPAMMTGSGSALFGLFRERAEARRALERMGEVTAFSVSLVPRSRYRRLWRRALEPHVLSEPLWPPRSRYAR